MGVNCIIVLTVMVLSYVYLSDQLVPEAVGVKTDSNSTSPPHNPVLICVNQLKNGTYGPAATCKNGRDMAGCCVERNYCDFSTKNIDRIMYGPTGYRDTCGSYVCCPMEFVKPIVTASPNATDDTFKDFDDD